MLLWPNDVRLDYTKLECRLCTITSIFFSDVGNGSEISVIQIQQWPIDWAEGFCLSFAT